MKTTISASVDIEIATLLAKQKNKSELVNKALKKELNCVKTERDIIDVMEENIVKNENKKVNDELSKKVLKDSDYWDTVEFWYDKTNCGRDVESKREPVGFSAEKLGINVDEFISDIKDFRKGGSNE